MEFKIRKKQYLNIIDSNRVLRTVGFIDWDKHVYISPRYSCHQFRTKGNGFGCSLVILNDLDKHNIKRIIIPFKGEFLKATTDMFFYHGIKYENKGDIQYILPLDKFERDKTFKIEEIQEGL